MKIYAAFASNEFLRLITNGPHSWCEIEKEQSENLDVEYHIAEDLLNVNGKHKKVT